MKKASYLRYADDQFLFAQDKETLHLLIFKLSKRLSHFGLSINQKKVEIQSTTDLINKRSFTIFDIFQNDQDKNNKEKNEKFVVQIKENKRTKRKDLISIYPE